MIDGIAVAIDRDAVVITAGAPLTVVSTAAVGGGFAFARSLVNLHVSKDFAWQDLEAQLAAFARDRALSAPCVGLFTAAWTEKAEEAVESAHGVTAMVVTTVGLSHPVAAGADTAKPMATGASTINTIVVVEAAPEPAALVNLVATVTEVKVAALAAAGVRCADGRPATGTATDAVVVAATGRGPRCRFGGPASDLGAVVARAARGAIARGIARWLEAHA